MDEEYKSKLSPEMKAMIHNLAEKEKEEMKEAGEWDNQNLIGSISRAYARVLDRLLQAMELDKEDEDD